MNDAAENAIARVCASTTPTWLLKPIVETNRITIRQATYYHAGEARSALSHDWLWRESAARPVCRPNCWTFTRNTPEVAFLRDDREFCKDCEALRAAAE